jgi:hypothetical protein
MCLPLYVINLQSNRPLRFKGIPHILPKAAPAFEVGFRSSMKSILKFKAAAAWRQISNQQRRELMKLDHATHVYLEYHKTNSGKKYNRVV